MSGQQFNEWVKQYDGKRRLHDLLALAMEQGNEAIMIHIVQAIETKKASSIWQTLNPWFPAVKYYQLFYWACLKRSKKILHFLIRDKKIKLNKPLGPEKLTPLMIAIRYQCDEALTLLLSYPNIDVNAKDKKGMTALMYAIVWHSDCGLSLLLENEQMNINAVDKFGNSALMLAIKNSAHKEAECMLHHPKINLNIANKAGLTPLTQAIIQQDHHIVHVMLSVDDAIIKTKKWVQSPVFMINNKAVLEVAVLHHPSLLKELNEYGDTLLHHYSKLGWIELVAYLLKCKGVDVNVQDQCKRVPLMLAVQSGHHGVTQLLLSDKRVDLKAIDINGRSIIHYVENSSCEVKALFD